VGSEKPSGPFGALSIKEYSLSKLASFVQKFRENEFSGQPIHIAILEVISIIILIWQHEKNLALGTVWKLPEEDFVQTRGCFVDFIELELYKLRGESHGTETVNSWLKAKAAPQVQQE
jgi:hypothetical protein